MSLISSKTLKKWLPPILVSNLKNIVRSNISLCDRYSNWHEALARCEGYDSDEILERTLTATQKVKQGQAVYQRDGELFEQIIYSWPVTSALMFAAAQNNGNLNVVDFGGSFASSYFQNKKFLDSLQSVQWRVVEQKSVVEAGSRNFASQEISFHSDLHQCLQDNLPNVVLLSSVLQYLEKPVHFLAQLSKYKVPLIILDRTPFLKKPDLSYVRIQKVPKRIYRASYPCWLFSKDELIASIYENGYTLVEEFDSLDDLSPEATWQGLIFRYPPHESLSE
jgi:putative methyltransferase (TIGR04325 family)